VFISPFPKVFIRDDDLGAPRIDDR